MRLHLNDTDVQLPQSSDITSELMSMPKNLQDIYLPPDMECLMELWTKLLQLSMKLEDILLLHYRPRKPLFSLSQLEIDHSEIIQLLESMTKECEFPSRITTLHQSHLRCYFNVVIITLHRSYIIDAPENLAQEEQDYLRRTALQRSKDAATGTTNILNRLITQDMIDKFPAQLVAGLMPAMQIHLFGLARSQGLARQYASHNLDLHMIVLSHLKQTYWAADIIRNLFVDALKAIESAKAAMATQDPLLDSTQHPDLESRPDDYHEKVGNSVVNVTEAVTPSESAFEDMLVSFNPFENMQCLFEAR